MEITREELENAVLLTVKGNVDIYTSPQLRGEMKVALQKKAPRIVIDLEQVGFVDSSGLATLIEGLQKVNGYRGKLILCHLTPAVLSVFQLSNLDTLFDIRASRAEALEA